ncbi:MAG: epoxyqueuosine reductase [Deltaproteobacteria bacterium]|nr:epoxyqueuosine reductase [Deltaproteobacteria bacterium]
MVEKALSEAVKHKALELGYDACGIADATDFEEYLLELARRSALFPESKRLYDWLERLARPRAVFEWARSLVVCARRYNRYRLPDGLKGRFGKVYVFDGRLPGSNEHAAATAFEAFLQENGMQAKNTDPVAATTRLTAVRAGLGRIAKNNFLYTKYGSWQWLDVWAVDKELTPDEPLKKTSLCPDGCTRCIDACPTKALQAPNTMNMGACIAYLSYSLRDLPSEDRRSQMGEWLYGCDVCQDVCPMNERKWKEGETFPGLDALASVATLENIFQMDEISYKTVLQPWFWYIKPEAQWIWRASSIRAMANSGKEEYREYIDAACNDSDARVREMGLWAKQRVTHARED